MIHFVDELELRGKHVFLRLDLNVPIDKNKNITDATRIKEAIPTIRYCLEKGAKLLLCSHLGRPDGKVNMEYSLEPVAAYLAKEFSRDVVLLDELGDGVHQMVRHGNNNNEILLLENIRFYPGEEKNDTEFAHDLARLAEVYINDAFGTCHRKHASIYGVPMLLSEVAAGFLIKKELQFLNPLISDTEHPFAVVAGGAKVTDKIKALDNLINHVDRLIIGGAMAYAFLKAQGHNIGLSKCEKEGVPVAKALLEKAKNKGVKIFLPVDHIIAFPGKDPTLSEPIELKEIDIPEEASALDIGMKTREIFAEAIMETKTVFWNGPMGFFEKPQYAEGTRAVGKAIEAVRGIKVAGGGDTISAIHSLCREANFSLLSTGGGASLQFLEGRGLPGIDILNKKGTVARKSTQGLF